MPKAYVFTRYGGPETEALVDAGPARAPAPASSSSRSGRRA